MPTAAVVHPSADQYGSDRQLVESLAALVGAGWRVVLVLPSAGPLVGLVARAVPEVEVRVAGFVAGTVLRKAMLRPLPLLGLLARAPLDIVRAVRLVRAIDPDVLYVNTLTVPLWLAVGRLARRPTLVHVHEAEDDAPRLLRVALALPLLLAGLVVANSAASARTLTEVLPRLGPRVRVIPNGVPEPVVPAGVEPEPGLLVLVARLSPRKGIDVALDAVALLRTQGRDVRIEVCGTVFPGYEWYERELRERAARPDLLGGVTLRGYVAPTGPELARAEIVLVPSRSEPFGNTAVEGLLAQRPVVASAVQGLAEIIVDGRTGVLVGPDDPAALAAAVGALLDAPDHARELARAGRADALARFSTGRYGGQIVASVDGLRRPGR